MFEQHEKVLIDLPERLTYQVRHTIDHTNLKPTATRLDILALCDEAVEYGFASVCVNPCWVSTCRKRFYTADAPSVCCVIGFPLGASTTADKLAELREAIREGANEADVVANIGWIKQRSTAALTNELRSFVNTCGRHVLCKLIIECCLLTDEEKSYICRLAAETGFDFVKTSTGFSTGGALISDIAIMRDAVGPRCSIKAAGGIRTLDDARQFIKAGCSRIGTSNGVAIAEAELAEEREWRKHTHTLTFDERVAAASERVERHFDRTAAVGAAYRRRRDEWEKLLAIRHARENGDAENVSPEVEAAEAARIEALMDFDMFEWLWQFDAIHDKGIDPENLYWVSRSRPAGWDPQAEYDELRAKYGAEADKAPQATCGLFDIEAEGTPEYAAKVAARAARKEEAAQRWAKSHARNKQAAIDYAKKGIELPDWIMDFLDKQAKMRMLVTDKAGQEQQEREERIRKLAEIREFARREAERRGEVYPFTMEKYFDEDIVQAEAKMLWSAYQQLARRHNIKIEALTVEDIKAQRNAPIVLFPEDYFREKERDDGSPVIAHRDNVNRAIQESKQLANVTRMSDVLAQQDKGTEGEQGGPFPSGTPSGKDSK